MSDSIIFDPQLIEKYSTSGPRYTSYPTANLFHDAVGAAEFGSWLEESNGMILPCPISLYIHIPFCDTVCFYCGCNKIATKDRSKAAVYLTYLAKELELLGKLFDNDRIVEQLHWGGGTPTFLDGGQMRGLMDTIRSHFNLAADDIGEYSIEIDPRSVDPETIHLLRDIGFNRSSLGVQDFDPDVQKAVNRIQPESQTMEALHACREAGFHSINLDLIYGLPKQTPDSFERTLNTAIAANPDRLAIYNYAHLPERFPPQRRIQAQDLPSPQQRLEMLGLAIQRLTDAGYVYIGMDHFAKPDDELSVAQQNGTLQRNFQGYSSHRLSDMVAAGVSSISNIAGNFSQNHYELEPYYQALDNDQLPIAKGYASTGDDHIRAAVISALMCHYQLDVSAFQQKWDIDFWHYFAESRPLLQPMVDDCLLSMDKFRIQVSARGRLLLRNICMAFDAHLQSGLQVKKFSNAV